jgi:carbamoylphosphate synthase large subunit
MEYYIVSAPFENWKVHFQCICLIKYVDSINFIDKSKKYKIIPICPNDFVRYNNNELLFVTNCLSIQTLNNKGLFAEFMMEYFVNHVPTTIYYNINNKKIYKSNLTTPLMIQKSTLGCGAINVKIIKDNEYKNNLEEYYTTKNIIISEYIKHDIIFAGHFLVVDGVLIDKIYFYVNIEPNSIYSGRLLNYKVSEKLSCDESIFMKIFEKLNYSGFTCVDFTICDGNIRIFEINPRIGGSLIFNVIYLDRFLSKLKKYFSNKYIQHFT